MAVLMVLLLLAVAIAAWACKGFVIYCLEVAVSTAAGRLMEDAILPCISLKCAQLCAMNLRFWKGNLRKLKSWKVMSSLYRNCLLSCDIGGDNIPRNHVTRQTCTCIFVHESLMYNNTEAYKHII